jgi:hypothetical protein
MILKARMITALTPLPHADHSPSFVIQYPYSQSNTTGFHALSQARIGASMSHPFNTPF